jgi:hypothetical protein
VSAATTANIAGERGGAQIDEPGRGEHLCCLDCACETDPEGERQAARVPDLGRCRPATHERRPATNQSRMDQAVSSGAIGSGGRSPRCPALPVVDVRCACQLPAVLPSGVSGRISRTPLPTGSTASGCGGEACGGDDLQCSVPAVDHRGADHRDAVGPLGDLGTLSEAAAPLHFTSKCRSDCRYCRRHATSLQRCTPASAN